MLLQIKVYGSGGGKSHRLWLVIIHLLIEIIFESYSFDFLYLPLADWYKFDLDNQDHLITSGFAIH
jgi:hypothetical protein